jgi:hypothetical protein
LDGVWLLKHRADHHHLLPEEVMVKLPTNHPRVVLHLWEVAWLCSLLWVLHGVLAGYILPVGKEIKQ